MRRVDKGYKSKYTVYDIILKCSRGGARLFFTFKI